MARKILHQKMCASACERNWSSYGFIHSKSRNRLTNDRAKDLVFVFTNMRVARGITKVRNPHTSIYRRYEERRATNDGLRPIPIEQIPLIGNDDISHDEEDIQDFDAIDDANEVLQGLSLDIVDEFLTRIPSDIEGFDASEWENEADLQMYPTIDDSQPENDNDDALDFSFEMPL